MFIVRATGLKAYDDLSNQFSSSIEDDRSNRRRESEAESFNSLLNCSSKVLFAFAHNDRMYFAKYIAIAAAAASTSWKERTVEVLRGNASRLRRLQKPVKDER